MIKKILFYSAKGYDIKFFNQINSSLQVSKQLQFSFLPQTLNSKNAIESKGFDSVCLFVNDKADTGIIDTFKNNGVKLITLRCAGFNNVDFSYASSKGIPTVRVPAYSPFGVAEHAMALCMGVLRKTHKAYNRVRDGNYSIEGLESFELYGKTVGIAGTGKIGTCFARICNGFGMKIIGYDKYQSEEFKSLGGKYVSLSELLSSSDVISLHLPLNSESEYLINSKTIKELKDGVILLNTGRGPLVKTVDVIEGLKSGKIGGYGADVYENEGPLFFDDHSNSVIQDDILRALTAFPNVLLTAHQAFLSREALTNIASTSISNILDISETGNCQNVVK